MSGNFPRLNIMFGSGRNLSFVIQELIMLPFYVSQKKSTEFQHHLEQDKQQPRPSHIISINYLDLDQAYATHELQVQSKFSYQNSHIQNSRDFKAKNQVLERNYNRATIHHFYCERLSQSLLFIELLKIKLKENQTHFLFCFHFQIIYYY